MIGKIVFVIVLLVFLAACEQPSLPSEAYRFEVGECASIKISGEEAMVVYRYRTTAQVYKVRIGKAEIVSNGFLGPTIRTDRSYAKITFRDFELEKCE